MSYIPSVNIEINTASDFRYIVTENAKLVAGNIVNSYNSGHHSFSIIGTYGTGKSSFILALEDDLANGKNQLIKKGVLGPVKGFEFLNIVGDYAPLGRLLSNKLNSTDDNPINALNSYYQSLRKQNKFLVIVVDEFGKILEHAANNNPEKELYFLQKLSEFVNVPSRSIILLTTLHQNFGSYAAKLTETQRNEWQKVKGRFQEIVFVEPVEQLLSLTAKRLDSHKHISKAEEVSLNLLYDLGIRSKIVSRNLEYKTAEAIYPLDPISAVCLTLAIQRYGQNERSLFSFLSAKGEGSINDFNATPSTTYNVAKVYDYLTYHFYSAITETNADSMGWRSLSVAIERIECSNLDKNIISDCLKMIKTIGLINMFFNGIVLDDDFLVTYGENALGTCNVPELIKILVSHQVVRFAKYKSQYILFEGTNIDIEDELYKAASIVPTPTLSIEEIAPYIKQKAAIASASYYKTGTPRYFEYRITNEPTIVEPIGDIDGFIHLVFPLSDIESDVIELSASSNAGASIYGYFKNTEKIVRHLYEIKKLQYVTLTLIPFFNSFLDRYHRLTSTAVADSGYGSEENYRFMDEAGIDAYVKYNYFHKEQRMHYTPNPFHPESLHYNADEDYYVCPMGQHMTRIGTSHSKTASGYRSENAQYRAQNCKGCPLRGMCYKAKADQRIIEVNHRLNQYKRKARELLTSEDGIKHRGRRCIEPEAVFGQMKFNIAYRRFRHFGKDKVTMDFAFFAIAFNIMKMCSKIAKQGKNGDKTPHFGLFVLLYRILPPENRIF